MLVAAVISAGCAEPQIPQTVTPTTDAAPLETVTVDPLGEALDDAVNVLIASLDEINAVLATNATDADTLDATAQSALELLVFADDAVFPQARPKTERNATGNDRLSVVSNAARAFGGHRGDMIINALRDTLAGDLGGWERDPAGMRNDALSAYGATVQATQAKAAALPAGGMRAIAWIAFATSQDSPAVIHEAFMYAQTHLEIVAFSVRAANAT